VTVIAGPAQVECAKCNGSGLVARMSYPGGLSCAHWGGCDGTGKKHEPCVLYTAYGGPQAPREPGDPAIKDFAEQAASEIFWSEHALAFGVE
jgi:hypothetical protein